MWHWRVSSMYQLTVQCPPNYMARPNHTVPSHHEMYGAPKLVCEHFQEETVIVHYSEPLSISLTLTAVRLTIISTLWRSNAASCTRSCMKVLSLQSCTLVCCPFGNCARLTVWSRYSVTEPHHILRKWTPPVDAPKPVEDNSRIVKCWQILNVQCSTIYNVAHSNIYSTPPGTATLQLGQSKPRDDFHLVLIGWSRLEPTLQFNDRWRGAFLKIERSDIYMYQYFNACVIIYSSGRNECPLIHPILFIWIWIYIYI